MSDESKEEDGPNLGLVGTTEETDIAIRELSPEQINKIKDCTVAQLLRQDQAGLFELIYQSQGLIRKILYCLIYIFIFAGCYGVILGINQGIVGIGIMALKMPLLFLVTTAITTPLLFSFNLFLGARLNIQQAITILLVGSYEMSLTLISLGPILLLFVVSSQGQMFVNIINILFVIIAVSMGLGLIWRAISYFIKRNQSPTHTLVVKIWIGIYAFVGLQLAWAVQIFGDLSELPIFKQLGIEGNFYMAIFELAKRWMGQ